MTVLELDGVFQQITPPPATAYRYGLFSVATPEPAADGSWEGMGVEWVSQACTTPRVTYDPCIVDVVPPLTADTFCQSVQTEPFTVYEMTDANLRNRAASEAAVRDRLNEVEQFAVEAALWTNLDAAVTEVTVNVGSLLEALAFVEQDLVERYPALGVIHMNRYAAILLGDSLVREGGKLTTMLGTPVIAGGGYGAIAGVAPANTTIYASGPVVLRRGAVQTTTVLDQDINRATAMAYRSFVVSWDCAAVGATATT